MAKASNMTPDQKTALYTSAISEALTIAASEAGAPDINAAIAALTDVQAALIAKILDRNQRRLAEKKATDSLGLLISKYVQDRLSAAGATQ